MPGQAQTLAPCPSYLSKAVLWNAIRVAFVNKNHTGAISYDPLTTPAPSVSVATLINSARLAQAGQLQS